jgi:hypothetical protein
MKDLGFFEKQRFFREFQYLVYSHSQEKYLMEKMLTKCHNVVKNGGQLTEQDFQSMFRQMLDDARKRDEQEHDAVLYTSFLRFWEQNSLYERMDEKYEIAEEVHRGMLDCTKNDNKSLFVCFFDTAMSDIFKKSWTEKSFYRRHIKNSNLLKTIQESVLAITRSCIEKLTEKSRSENYSTLDIVETALIIQQTKDFKKLGVMLKAKVLKVIYIFASTWLEMEKRRYYDNHSLECRIKLRRESLLTRFNIIIQKLDEEEALVHTLSFLIAKSILCITYYKSVEQLTHAVIAQPWTSNENVLVARMALDVSEKIKEGNALLAVKAINNPELHSHRVMNTLYKKLRDSSLANNIEDEVQKNLKKLNECLIGREGEIEDCLLIEASIISKSHDDPATKTTKFIRSANKWFRWLWIGIPKKDDCMDGWMDIVQKKHAYGSSWEAFVEKIAVSLSKLTIIGGKNQGFASIQFSKGSLNSDASTIINWDRKWPPSLKIIREGISGIAKSNLQMRCMKKCPRCAAPCLYPKNHWNKHDCFHQIQGLGGSYYHKIEMLGETSCVAEYQSSVRDEREGKVKIAKMGILKDGSLSFYPWREFTKHYPEWNCPQKLLCDISAKNGETMKSVSGVTEILWNKHQNALVEFFPHCKRNDSKVETEYLSIDQVIRELKDFLGDP